LEEITEHLRSARELARVRRLAEIGQMTAAVAHEVRNPLTSIRSAAQMVTLAPEQAAEFAQMVEEEVLKLDALCEEFLAFARPIAIRLRPVRLGDLAMRVAEGHRPQFCDAGVALEVEIPSDSPTINADAPRVEGVVRNLLLNALQASGPGDRVRLSVGGDGFVVEDTGCGIPPESLERLFTPFFTTKAQGTGLGLCNVRKTVEAHGGEVEVRSEMGKGSRFEVRLGLEDAA
jgi:two-component system sensor histidine kinase AtoS